MMNPNDCGLRAFKHAHTYLDNDNKKHNAFEFNLCSKPWMRKYEGKNTICYRHSTRVGIWCMEFKDCWERKHIHVVNNMWHVREKHRSKEIMPCTWSADLALLCIHVYAQQWWPHQRSLSAPYISLSNVMHNLQKFLLGKAGEGE